jgi:hypothetical protein
LLTQLAGNQNTSTSAAGSILVNFFEAHNFGHVIEALHYCLGHHRANPESPLSVLLNALAPTELAGLCPFIKTVHPVQLPGYPENASDLRALGHGGHLSNPSPGFVITRTWYEVVEPPRRLL